MWLGNLNGHQRTWTKREVEEISKWLKDCNYTLPTEIHRSIRSFEHISYWKGTEFRTFLLYLGIVVLKNSLVQREYEMFLKLHCAVTICTTNVYSHLLPLARMLFVDFIENHIDCYGEGSITINIHNLSHVVDDVAYFGPLDTISAYEFENALHHLKLRLKQCNKPLEQIARRIAEISVTNANALKSEDDYPQLKHEFNFPDAPRNSGFRYIKYKPNAILSSAYENKKNIWFLTSTNNIVEFHYVVKDENQNTHLIWGSALKNIDSFFQKPFDSKCLNIFVSDVEKCDPKYYDMRDIKAKMFSLSHENRYVFIPLLHTL